MAVVAVGVLLEELHGRPPFIRTVLEAPASLEPGADCQAHYRLQERLFRACEGSAFSGALYATRQVREQYGIVITQLRGVRLPPECGMGFASAAAAACYRALGEEIQAESLEMEGWERIEEPDA